MLSFSGGKFGEGNYGGSIKDGECGSSPWRLVFLSFLQDHIFILLGRPLISHLSSLMFRVQYVPETVRKFERRRMLDLKVTNTARGIDCYEQQSLQIYSNIFFSFHILDSYASFSNQSILAYQVRAEMAYHCYALERLTPLSEVSKKMLLKLQEKNCCLSVIASYAQEIMRISTDDAIEVTPLFPSPLLSHVFLNWSWHVVMYAPCIRNRAYATTSKGSRNHRHLSCSCLVVPWSQSHSLRHRLMYTS